jgi:hypothetical protein
MKVKSPDQRPEMITRLRQGNFYGDIHLTFRHGEITRIVTEQSQVFNSTQGRPYNDYHKQ